LNNEFAIAFIKLYPISVGNDAFTVNKMLLVDFMC